MTDATTPDSPPKVRKAQIITPPNTIKGKVGSGGIDKAVLNKAEENLAQSISAVDFTPIADELLKDMDAAIAALKAAQPQTEALVEALLHPAAQFKAQGGMYGYPLVSDIADTLINFLEAVTLPVHAEALDIAAAHRKAITAIVHMKLKEATHPQGVALKVSLVDACDRFFKSRKGG